jgi:hypothetical protein
LANVFFIVIDFRRNTSTTPCTLYAVKPSISEGTPQQLVAYFMR